MSYAFFLLYLTAFVGAGLVLGIIVLTLAYKNRIAVRSLLAPIRIRRNHSMIKPIPLRGPSSPSSKA